MSGAQFLQVVMALVGSVGYGLLFRVSGYKLLAAGVGGAFNWLVYLAALSQSGDVVFAFFCAALATAALAEVFARWLKTPVLTLLVPMLVPLVPGGNLYYTTLALVQGDMPRFVSLGALVIKEAGAIALGVILVACVVQTMQKAVGFCKEKRRG